MAEREFHEKGTACCSPFSTCLLTSFCPCITFGRVRHRMQEGHREKYDTCNGSCWGYCGLMVCGFQWVWQAMNRSEMRAKYHLEGNLCTDLLCACCCHCCDLIQQDKEACYREQERAGLIVDGQPGKAEGMNYQPSYQPGPPPPQPGQY
ncbi:PLAC8-domain-containing protein [Viridothelium virens]|uniref:PLAC8-domain-containing protein n=1 Tax=Viridothelium virens TaxID=1048519 RepID=A0A6A6GYZ1_VIRVR|nr:PLAC8-domain-containing protein [Viridothelium virens]